MSISTSNIYSNIASIAKSFSPVGGQAYSALANQTKDIDLAKFIVN